MANVLNGAFSKGVNNMANRTTGTIRNMKARDTLSKAGRENAARKENMGRASELADGTDMSDEYKYQYAVNLAKQDMDGETYDTAEFRNLVDDYYAQMDPEKSAGELRGENPVGNFIRGLNEGVDQIADWGGDALEGAWDFTVGNVAGGLGGLVGAATGDEDLGDEWKQAASDAMSPEMADAIASMGIGMAVGAIPGIGVPASIGMSALQNSDELYEAMIGRDAVTGEKLNAAQVAGRVGGALLDTALSAAPAVGKVARRSKALDYVDDLGKMSDSEIDEVASTLAENASKNYAKRLTKQIDKAATDVGDRLFADEVGNVMPDDIAAVYNDSIEAAADATNTSGLPRLYPDADEMAYAVSEADDFATPSAVAESRLSRDDILDAIDADPEVSKLRSRMNEGMPKSGERAANKYRAAKESGGDLTRAQARAEAANPVDINARDDAALENYVRNRRTGLGGAVDTIRTGLDPREWGRQLRQSAGAVGDRIRGGQDHLSGRSLDTLANRLDRYADASAAKGKAAADASVKAAKRDAISDARESGANFFERRRAGREAARLAREDLAADASSAAGFGNNAARVAGAVADHLPVAVKSFAAATPLVYANYAAETGDTNLMNAMASMGGSPFNMVALLAAPRMARRLGGMVPGLNKVAPRMYGSLGYGPSSVPNAAIEARRLGNSITSEDDPAMSDEEILWRMGTYPYM